MALSMTQSITDQDIFHVTVLKSPKVFLLESITGEKLVIKVDAVGTAQISSANVIARVIDPNTAVKVINAAEIFALKRFCRDFAQVSGEFDKLGIADVKGYAKSDKDAIKDLTMMLNDLDKYPEPFVKMPAMNLHNLETAISSRANGDKAMVRDFAASLKANGGLEKLGKIVAGDLFNGNTDRFYPNSSRLVKIGPFTIDLQVLVNIGNVMMVIGGSVSFVDFLDPQSADKELSQAPGATWGGNTMTNSRDRKQFAKDTVSDLEAILHPRKSKYSLKTKLGRDASKRVEAGMIEGAKLICKALESKFNGPGWPDGAKAKYTAYSKIS